MKLLCDKIYLSIHKLALYVREEHPKKIIITFHQSSSPKNTPQRLNGTTNILPSIFKCPSYRNRKKPTTISPEKTELAD